MEHHDYASKHNLCDIYLLLCVQCWAHDDGQRKWPKHIEFYSKINLRNSASRWFYYKNIGIRGSLSVCLKVIGRGSHVCDANIQAEYLVNSQIKKDMRK
jgi:hypothetical protein